MRVRAGSIDQAYEERGSGSVPLLLVHGFPHSRALWRPQLEGLRADCRCIAPDLRGFGETDVSPPYGMNQYADDLAALLDVLEVNRCVVAGLSMGGYIAFAMYRRHRSRVAGLVLADTRAEADGDEARQKRRDMIETARRDGMAAVADAMITGMVGKTTRETSVALVGQVHEMLASAPVEGAVGALEAMMDRPDSTPLLREITVPTTILVGTEDTLTPPKLARTMHDAIAGSTYVELPAAGHVSNLEQPAAFNEALRQLVRRAGAP